MKSKRLEIGTRCIIFHEGKLLVQRRGSEGFRLPGGKLESTESLEGCVERELREELGISVKGKKLVYLVENIYIHRGNLRHEILFCYLCEVAGEAEPREAHVKVAWVEPREAIDKFKPLPLIQEIIEDYELRKFDPKYLLIVNDTLVRKVKVGGVSRSPGLQLRL